MARVTVPGFEKWLARALAFFMLAGSLFAAAPAKAHVCDRYDDARLARDLAAIKAEIGQQLPIRYSGLIARLEFRMAEPDEDGPLLPGAVNSGEEDAYIEIPANYYRTHCLMSVWTETMLNLLRDGPAPPLEAAINENMHCRRVEQASSTTCLLRVLNMPLPALAAPPPNQERRLERAIGDSLFLIIAHEIAHVVLAQRYAGRLDRSVANVELAADAFALQVALPADKDYSAVAHQLVPANIFADVYPTATPPPSEHPSVSCRLSFASFVGNQLAPYISGAVRWGNAAAGARGQATAPLATTADRVRATMARGEANIPRPLASCEVPLAAVAAMQANYRALLVAIDGAIEAAAGDDASLMTRLAQFRPDTDDVRQLFDSLLLRRLDDSLRRAHERTDDVAARAIYQVLIEVAERLRPEDLPVVANFFRSMDLGIERFRYAPPGSNTDRVIVRAEADLHDAERYLRESSVVRNWPAIDYHLGLFALGRGNCAEAARRFAKMREIADPTYAAQADPYRSLDRATTAQCASETRRLRDNWRELRGWQ